MCYNKIVNMLSKGLLLMVLLVMMSCDFMPSRLRIVDRNETLNTFLVRGNLPLRDNKFEIE